MSAWTWLLLAQGVLGAADTLWYHEHVYALPAHARQTAGELRLHAARDFVYAVLFLSLAFVTWHGAWAWLLAALLVAESAITLADFVIEDRVRAPLGGVAPGERVMHTVMAMVYGAFLASLLPELVRWTQLDTGFAARADVSATVRAALLVLGGGVLLSGVRDLGAACGLCWLQGALFTRRPERARAQSPVEPGQGRGLELVAAREAQDLGLDAGRGQARDAGLPCGAVDGGVGVAQHEGPA